MSLRARLALLVAVAVGLGVTLVALAAYFTVAAQLRAQFDAQLVSRARTAAITNLTNFNILGNVDAAYLNAGGIQFADIDILGNGVFAAGADPFPIGVAGQGRGARRA